MSLPEVKNLATQMSRNDPTKFSDPKRIGSPERRDVSTAEDAPADRFVKNEALIIFRNKLGLDGLTVSLKKVDDQFFHWMPKTFSPDQNDSESWEDATLNNREEPEAEPEDDEMNLTGLVEAFAAVGEPQDDSAVSATNPLTAPMENAMRVGVALTLKDQRDQYVAGRGFDPFPYQLDMKSPEVMDFLPKEDGSLPEKFLSPLSPSLEDLENDVWRKEYLNIKVFHPKEAPVIALAMSVLEDLDAAKQSYAVMGVPWHPTCGEEEFKALSSPEFQSFLERVHVRVNNEIQKEIKENPGARQRMELAEGLMALDQFNLLSSSLEIQGPPLLQSLTPEEIDEIKQVLLERGEIYEKFLNSEIDRIKKEDEGNRPLKESCYDGSESDCESDPDWVTPRVKPFQERLEGLNLKFKILRVLQVNGPEDLPKLKEILKDFSGLEEEHVRGLLSQEIDLVEKLSKKLPSSFENGPSLPEELAEITQMSSLDDRSKAYQTLNTRIDHITLGLSIEGAIEMYKAWAKTAERTDGIENALTPGSEFHDASYCLDMVSRFEEVKKVYDQGDFALAQQEYVGLERSIFAKNLREGISFDAKIDMIAEAFGIVLASFASELAADTFAPSIVRSLRILRPLVQSSELAAGAIDLAIGGTPTAVNLITFTNTLSAWKALTHWDFSRFYDTKKSPLKNISSFGWELFQNYVVFNLALPKITGLFFKSLDKALAFLAEKELLAEGALIFSKEGKLILATGEKVGEGELIGKNAKALLEERWAVLYEKNFVKAYRNIGGLMARWIGFGVGNFLTANLEEGRQSLKDLLQKKTPHYDLAGILNQSLKGMDHLLSFLLCMEGIGVLAHPLTQPILEVSGEKALAQYKAQLEEVGQKTEGLLKEFATGTSNPLELIRKLKDSLRIQKSILEAIPPEFKNPETSEFIRKISETLERFEAFSRNIKGKKNNKTPETSLSPVPRRGGDPWENFMNMLQLFWEEEPGALEGSMPLLSPGLLEPLLGPAGATLEKGVLFSLGFGTLALGFRKIIDFFGGRIDSLLKIATSPDMPLDKREEARKKLKDHALTKDEHIEILWKQWMQGEAWAGNLLNKLPAAGPKLLEAVTSPDLKVQTRAFELLLKTMRETGEGSNLKKGFEAAFRFYEVEQNRSREGHPYREEGALIRERAKAIQEMRNAYNFVFLLSWAEKLLQQQTEQKYYVAPDYRRPPIFHYKFLLDSNLGLIQEVSPEWHPSLPNTFSVSFRFDLSDLKLLTEIYSPLFWVGLIEKCTPGWPYNRYRDLFPSLTFEGSQPSLFSIK